MTVAIRDHARILRYAFASAIADLRVMYTWRTWTFAWLARILCQVTLFALLGRLIDSPERTTYLLIGNAVFIAATSVMLVCASTGWERMAGTLPLLVAAPAASFTVFAGRSVQWLLDGLACATLSLFLLAPLFDVHLPFPRAILAIPLIALVTVTIYCFGLVLAALALRAMELRSLIGNLGSMSLMVLTGVQVSVSFWPAPLTYLAKVLPLTHGLQAVRELLAGGSLAGVASLAGLELAVGVGWLLLAALAFRHFAESGRKDGSIEFGG